MLLDTNTLLVAMACASFFSAALLTGIYRINPGEPAIIFWGTGNFLFGVGSMLDAFYNSIGPEFTSTFATLTQTAGFALLAVGLMRFLHKNTHARLIAALLLLQIAIHTYFVFITPLLWVRIANISVFMAIIALWTLVALRSPGAVAGNHSVAVPFLRLGFSLTIISYALWFGYAVRVQPPGPLIAAHGQLASVALLQMLCTIVILNISFVLLVMERIHRLLSRRAAMDDLTAVFNRRAFNQIAEVELARADRSHNWPALIALDLDHFKSVNDRFGHAAGDDVLRRFSALIKSSTRAGDIIARMGGEEFAALLPATNLARAVSVAERIRAALEAERFSSGGQNFTVTTSIGLTIVLPHDTLHSAFVRADAALYAAKNAGRNQVMTNTPPLPANDPAATPQHNRAAAPPPPDPDAAAPDSSYSSLNLYALDPLDEPPPVRMPPFHIPPLSSGSHR